MDNLSTLVGSNYETSFIKFDRPYKVMVQASPEYRALPEDLLKLYVKNDQGEMVPYSAFMKIEKVYGLSEITRHNMYNAAEISGTPARVIVVDKRLQRLMKLLKIHCLVVLELIGLEFLRMRFLVEMKR